MVYVRISKQRLVFKLQEAQNNYENDIVPGVAQHFVIMSSLVTVF